MGSHCSIRSKPGVKRAPVLWEPAITAGIGQFAGHRIRATVPPGLEVNPVHLARRPTGCAAFAPRRWRPIVTVTVLAVAQRDFIVALAAQHNCPDGLQLSGFYHSVGLSPMGLICSHSGFRGWLGPIATQGESRHISVHALSEVRLVIISDREGAGPRTSASLLPARLGIE